jgi:hypothetical protein
MNIISIARSEGGIVMVVETANSTITALSLTERMFWDLAAGLQQIAMGEVRSFRIGDIEGVKVLPENGERTR